ncbi:MAG TPA: 50S ribosomal protein L30 [Thermoleophilaceae bacterium]|nr:50S ribosomal protein L30 [Thermoleophilaceae bacterium]
MAGTHKLRQVRSSNGSSRKQKDSLRTLGLGRIGKSAERTDDPAVRGLVRSVEHLIEVDDG